MTGGWWCCGEVMGAMEAAGTGWCRAMGMGVGCSPQDMGDLLPPVCCPRRAVEGAMASRCGHQAQTCGMCGRW